ncbi:PhoH family protein [Calditerrivibrio nitroreducens]|uniref:PhoH-like protein n=1 Tax=Calditerrivibrio nitroreducens (strain DSM 19672 / NBRC 101217 / Yu37-1) TaxID=768670 RepID=E4THQ2_CALNY|nr:PhoH family protein [Calditerrivibrio nitroreducens]ADR18877.1 PhoH family protein [Calditerrivibrio nitroreducens DSM 19672]
MQTRKIYIDESIIPQLTGPNDEYIRNIMSKMGVDIYIRSDEIAVMGNDEDADKAVNLLLQIKEMAMSKSITKSDIDYAIGMAKADDTHVIKEVLTEKVKVSGRAKEVTAKTKNQKRYIEAIKENDIVFGIGPAGTGKTYLAVAMAVNFYITKKVNRIILTRPAVEAGERLGFLPGDIADKINPYLRPLYDALYHMLDFERVSALIEKGVIELAPLAFMRGRTLDDAFIILDEAQNTTIEQMKMFLTRLGFNSKAVITGDITQIDLPNDKKSGLVLVRDVLKGIKGIEFVEFGKVDVVRNPIVQKIIKAYEIYENK